MLEQQWQKDTIKLRREKLRMERDGYLYTEVDWRLERGCLTRERLIDVHIASNGKGLWYKISNGPHPWNGQ